MYCKKCGAEIPEGSLFCSKCGTPVGSNEDIVDNSAVEAVNVIPNTVNPEPKTIKSKKPLSKKTKIWIIVGAAVLVIAIVLIIVFTTTGSHKNSGNSVGDGRYADGRKAYRYSGTTEAGKLNVTDITVTPCEEGLLAEFYLENDSQYPIAWGWTDPGRMALETYDGDSYVSSFDQTISYGSIPAGGKVFYRVLFRNASGTPAKLTFGDLSLDDPAAKLYGGDQSMSFDLERGELC